MRSRVFASTLVLVGGIVGTGIGDAAVSSLPRRPAMIALAEYVAPLFAVHEALVARSLAGPVPCAPAADPGEAR